MTRDTSIAAYIELKNSGDLSNIRWRVYDYIYKHGPVIQADIVQSYNDKKSCITPRFQELVDLGLIKCIGKVRSPYSGMSVRQYDITGMTTVVKKPKAPSLNDQVKDLRKGLNELNVMILSGEKLTRKVLTDKVNDILGIEEMKA